MFPKKNKKNLGFTLVETIVTIFIFSLLSLGASTLFTHLFINSNSRLASIDSVDQARVITSRFANEIRTASIGNDGSYPLYQADNMEITFFSNYKQADEIAVRIRYFIKENILYKGIIIPSGDPLTYDLDNEKISVLQKNISNNTEPIFYYYDEDFTGSSTPLVQPVNINDVKFVRINLNFLKQSERNSNSSFDISAGVSIRNLKNN